MPTRQKARTLLPCPQCPATADSERDLVIHLVEDHEAVWASTNSFGIDDLMIPAPRVAYDDLVVDEGPSRLRRMLARRPA